MVSNIQKQLNRIEKNQKIIIQKMNDINSVSAILLQELANRPELLASIKTHKGAGDKPVPKRRITMKERKNKIRERFYGMAIAECEKKKKD